MTSYPLRHLSIRVPWHDSKWNGAVCKAPDLNGSCVQLKHISESKQDYKELAVASKKLNEIPRNEWPCCVKENAMFMAPFELNHEISHASSKEQSRVPWSL